MTRRERVAQKNVTELALAAGCTEDHLWSFSRNVEEHYHPTCEEIDERGKVRKLDKPKKNQRHS